MTSSLSVLYLRASSGNVRGLCDLVFGNVESRVDASDDPHLFRCKVVTVRNVEAESEVSVGAEKIKRNPLSLK